MTSKIRELTDAVEFEHPDNSVHETVNDEVSTSNCKPNMHLLERSLLPPPKFPLEVFGERVREFIVDAAASKSAPVDYVAASLLAVAATVMGADLQGEVFDGWQEPSILWITLIGDPSCAKSPAMDTMTGFLREIEREFEAEYRRCQKNFDDQEEIPGTEHSRYLEELRTAQKTSSPLPDSSDRNNMSDKPRRKRIVTSDATLEALKRLLAFNHHGIMLHTDELMSHLKNLGRYGGSDRPFYLEAYGGRPSSVDRKSDAEPIDIPCMGISILGSTQPEPFFEMMKSNEDDGLFARQLLIWPYPVPYKRPTKSVDNEFMRQLLRNLLALRNQPCVSSLGSSRIVPFSEGAIREIDEWRTKRGAVAVTGSPALQSFVGKLWGTTVRLAVVLEFLSWATNPQTPYPLEISLESIATAIVLADEYLVPMYERCLGDATLSLVEQDARSLARWIFSRHEVNLNARDLRRSPHSPLQDEKRLEAAIKMLVEEGWLTFVGGRKGESKGRQRKDYRVNPQVFEGQ